MRKMMLLTSTAIALSVAGAAYAANPNVPSYSPYALMDVVASGPVLAMGENRAAFVDTGYAAASPANTNVPSYSPYAIAPQGR